MNILNKNFNKKNKTVGLNSKLTKINNIKYLPAFSKEWKNIIYSYNNIFLLVCKLKLNLQLINLIIL